MPTFARYIGIDYSGAETPNASLKGLRVYLAESATPPVEVPPPPSPRKYWTRRGIAVWLTERLAEDVPTLVGIDHGFSFPLRYFEVHRLKPDWSAFLDDFQRHWPTDENIYVDFVRDGTVGNGGARTGSSRWRRLTEERSGSAKSVFHFDVQGAVAKSTHAGIPWLRFIRQRLGERVHFWPFDGWDIRVGRSAIAEVYLRSDEVLAPAGNLLIGRAAFETAKRLYPKDRIEYRKGAMVLDKSSGEGASDAAECFLLRQGRETGRPDRHDSSGGGLHPAWPAQCHRALFVGDSDPRRICRPSVLRRIGHSTLRHSVKTRIKLGHEAQR